MRLEPCESKTNELPPIPNGWFAAAWSRDLRKGEVQRLYAFERELVLFRTRSGEAVVLDAFCPHMGAHLGIDGKVVGETVACPYHGWQFDRGGSCTHIPYCDEIPSRAKVRGWPVLERNHMIFVWHHAEGAAPDWEPSEVADLYSDDWSEVRYAEFETDVHVQDMAENSCDPVHFQYVHKSPTVPEMEINIDGRVLKMKAKFANPVVGTHDLTSDVEGIGLAIVRSSYGPGMEMITYSSSLPIERNRTLTRWALTVTNNIVDMVGDDHMNGILAGVQQDVPIWKNKVHRQKPLFCKADGYLVEFRKWIRQFY